MKKITKVLVIISFLLFLGLLENLPVYAYVADSDLPAPTEVTVPEVSFNSIRISWKAITWPELDPGKPLSNNLEETGYIVYYTSDGETVEHEWVFNHNTDEFSTTIDDLSEGTYYIIVCAATKRESHLGSVSYTFTPGKKSEEKKCTVKQLFPSFDISDYEINTGKKKTVKITSNTDMKISLKPLNYLAENKKYVTVKGGTTAKIVFSKKAKKGIYYFKSEVPGFDDVISIKVYDNDPEEVKEIEISKTKISSGKTTTVKVTNYWKTKITLEPENELAKESKYVKYKNGKTGKIIFDKDAPKGSYEFSATVKYPDGMYSISTTYTIEVS